MQPKTSPLMYQHRLSEISAVRSHDGVTSAAHTALAQRCENHMRGKRGWRSVGIWRQKRSHNMRTPLIWPQQIRSEQAELLCADWVNILTPGCTSGETRGSWPFVVPFTGPLVLQKPYLLCCLWLE